MFYIVSYYTLMLKYFNEIVYFIRYDCVGSFNEDLFSSVWKEQILLTKNRIYPLLFNVVYS